MGSTSGRATSRASVPDTARVLTQVIAPTLGIGVIVRRRAAMALAEHLDIDRAAVKLLRRLRSRYGSGPLQLRIPGRSMVVVLDPEDVDGILRRSASEFTPANWEKRAALGHFQPHRVLISRGRPRAKRRGFHEQMLETAAPMHELAPRVAQVADEEAEQLVSGAQLDWDSFATGWWQVVRRVVLGDQARQDRGLIEVLNQLRADANWAFLAPRRGTHQRSFQQRLREHLHYAETGSLAALIAQRGPADVDAAEQVPHWLFAFDAAGMVAFRTLALLATHRNKQSAPATRSSTLRRTNPRYCPTCAAACTSRCGCGRPHLRCCATACRTRAANWPR